MSYKKISLLLFFLFISIYNPVQAGIFNSIAQVTKVIKSVLKTSVVKSSKFMVEVGAGVTAAIVYTYISKSSISIEGEYVTIFEDIYASNDEGYSSLIPKGRYKINSSTGNSISINSPTNNISSLKLFLT
jgi:hypothetical protein